MIELMNVSIQLLCPCGRASRPVPTCCHCIVQIVLATQPCAIRANFTDSSIAPSYNHTNVVRGNRLLSTCSIVTNVMVKSNRWIDMSLHQPPDFPEKTLHL